MKELSKKYCPICEKNNGIHAIYQKHLTSYVAKQTGKALTFLERPITVPYSIKHLIKKRNKKCCVKCYEIL
jgi:nitrate reductase cytochrome c-type subunit